MKWLRRIYGLFFAPLCVECKQNATDGLLCERCRTEKLVWQRMDDFCELDGAVMAYPYEGGLKDVLHGLKFRRQNAYLEPLATEVAACLKKQPQQFAAAVDLVVPVPTSAERKAERGFDIPEAVCLKLRFGAASFAPDVLVRKRATLPQYGLKPEQRRQNLAACFAASTAVRGKSILLVDDILTTGATMDEAAATLKRAGAAKVYGLAVCGSTVNFEKA